MDKEVLFDNPISINAQSSSNRTGYGNEYYYDTLVYEGTKYGETSQFPIIGYKVTFWGEIYKTPYGTYARSYRNDYLLEVPVPQELL